MARDSCRVAEDATATKAVRHRVGPRASSRQKAKQVKRPAPTATVACDSCRVAKDAKTTKRLRHRVRALDFLTPDEPKQIKRPAATAEHNVSGGTAEKMAGG